MTPADLERRLGVGLDLLAPPRDDEGINREDSLARTVVDLHGLCGRVVHRAQVVAADELPEALVWRDRVFRRATLGASYGYRELEVATCR